MTSSHPLVKDRHRVRVSLWLAGLAGTVAMVWALSPGYAAPDPDRTGAPSEWNKLSSPRMEAAMNQAERSPDQRREMAESRRALREERMMRWGARGHATKGERGWVRSRRDRFGSCPEPPFGPRAPRAFGRGPMGFGPPDGPGAPRGLGADLGWMAARRLDLSAEQRESLASIRQETGDRMRELHESFEAGTVSAEQAGDQAIRLRQEAESKMHAVLTDEQRGKLDDLKADRQERIIERRSGQIGRQTDRQAAFYINQLGLKREQASAVRRVLEGTIPARRQIADRVEAGELAPEKAFFLMRQVDKDAENEIRGQLRPDQAKVLDAIHTLRDFRGGPRPDGPLGPPPRGRGPHRGDHRQRF